MLALVMPLPSISRFSMPTPFGNQHSHTWALCHGTTFSSAQLILLEGKIRPANWTYHKNPHRSATFQPLGHTILAEKFPMRTRQSQHGWKQFSWTPSRRKQRANKALLWARCSEEPMNILGSRAEANEKAQVHVAEKGVVNTSEKYTIAPQQPRGSPFHRIEMG